MTLKDVSRSRRPPPSSGLSGLEGVPLGFKLERLLDAALAGSGGSPAWRHRKSVESRELLALSRLAPHRMSVEQLDLSESLRAVIHLRAPVPTRQPGSDEVVIRPGALLGLQVRQGALLTPQPGASFIQILRPEGVFLAQVPTDPPHVLCLAPVLPAGVHCKEMILMSYAALTLQNFQIDAAHPAGVFNIEAARWWQENASRIPLTREPFLESGPALEDAGR
jgi:hypothetical protein